VSDRKVARCCHCEEDYSSSLLTRIYLCRPVTFGSCAATGAGSDQVRDRSDVSGTRGYTVGSVIKKRRKRMAKKKHRKLLKRTRIQRRRAGK
jgi:hypothetical protein